MKMLHISIIFVQYNEYVILQSIYTVLYMYIIKMYICIIYVYNEYVILEGVYAKENVSCTYSKNIINYFDKNHIHI